jgi:hypothetical protein
LVDEYELSVTTRKPEKTNGITDGIFPSEIISFQNLSVYTDGINPSATWSVYTDENIPSVYTDRVAYFCRYIPTVSPTGYTVCLEICNGVVTSDDFTDGITEGFKLR